MFSLNNLVFASAVNCSQVKAVYGLCNFAPPSCVHSAVQFWLYRKLVQIELLLITNII